MPDEKDYYGILHVPTTADDQALKRAYRKRARQLHPDRHPNDPLLAEGFKALTQAYQVLSDPEKRAAYDRNRTLKEKSRAQPAVSAEPGSAWATFFKGIFSSGLPAENGKDLHTKLSVDLTDLASSSKIRLELPSTQTCPECSGQAILPRKNTSERPKDCPACQGCGRKPYKNNLEIKIPSGLENGTRIKIKGEGEAGLRGGMDGDLYVAIQVNPHPLLKRKGHDLTCLVPITPATAILGGTVQVPGTNGPLTLKIPAGTQTNTLFRLRRQGLRPATKGRQGDLLVTVCIDSPKRLSSKERQRIEEAFAQIDPKRYPSIKKYRNRMGKIKNKRPKNP
jgi:molecular chaperone DnaJ